MEKTDCVGGYCNTKNFIKAISTISEDLYIVGLPPVSEYNASNPAPCIVSLINTVWTLLKQQQNLIDKKRDLEHGNITKDKEINCLKEKQNRLEKELVFAQDALKKEKNNSFNTKGEKSEIARTTKCLKQEIQDLKSTLKNKEVRLKAMLRRHQEEVMSLEAKMRKMLVKERERNLREHSGSSKDFKKTLDNNGVRYEDIYEDTIRSLQSNVQSLVQENLELRKMLDYDSDDELVSLFDVNLSSRSEKEEKIIV